MGSNFSASYIECDALLKIALQLPTTAGSARAPRVGQCGGAWGGDGRLTLIPLTTKSSLTRLHNSVSAHGPQPK